MILYYDKDGSSLETLEWAKKFEDFNYRRVAEDRVGRYYISTIWVGANHRFIDNGPPLIFETMIFKEDDPQQSSPGIYQRRYSTLAEAQAGHEQAVKSMRLRAA